MENKKSKWIFFLVLLVLIIVIINVSVLIGYTPQGKAITGKIVSAYNDATTKLVCKEQQYEYEKEYIETVSGKNCDYDRDCRCIHKSWWGLGACDSCRCKKTKTEIGLKEVCIKIKKWQIPNYNENWLNYPELYDRSGNKIK